MNYKCKLDLPNNTNGMILTIEDKILSILFREKSLTKYELQKVLNVDYKDLFIVMERMETKGYIVKRKYENISTYYLTMPGVYEMEYRFNCEYFLYLHFKLESYGYDRSNVERFLKNRFYNLYIAGKWDESTLNDQYKEWCKSNNIDIYSKDINYLILK